jgi:hypothetical protein
VCHPVEAAGIDNRSTDRGAVATDELRQRMHRHIGALLEHTGTDRRRDCVVEDQREPREVSRLRPRRHVEDVQSRVADRLGEDQARALVGEASDGAGVVGIGPADLDAVLREGVREQVVSPSVELRDRDDVVACTRDVEHGVGDGRLPGRGDERGNAALEGCKAFLEHGPRRIHDARVDVARHSEREQVGRVLGVVEDKRRRLVDRHSACVGRTVRLLATMQRDGLGAVMLAHVVLLCSAV